MRHPVTRLLHVLLSVPVVTALVITVSPSAHAAAAAEAPLPLVIVIDPGHGGAPDAAHPDVPWDPGAIAASGLMEKDVALAVSKRLQALLQQDDVSVVLTRTDDSNPSIEQRSATANNDHALLFLSIHFNSFTDATATGSLVLYPKGTDVPFAQALSDALTRDLTPLGVGGNGLRLRDNWWLTPTMPVATVEPAYLSNPHEAALLGDPGFQQVLARSLRSGLEAYQPIILQRKAEIAAWNAAHPAAPVIAPHPAVAHSTVVARGGASSWLPGLVRDVVLAALLAAVVRWPRVAWRVLLGLIALAQMATDRLLVRRAATRRRRRAVRRRSLALQTQRYARPHHVYDELF